MFEDDRPAIVKLIAVSGLSCAVRVGRIGEVIGTLEEKLERSLHKYRCLNILFFVDMAKRVLKALQLTDETVR